MSDALFPDVLECGCARGLGHSCRVPWMTEEEWGGQSPNNGKVITEGSTGAGGAGTPPVIPRPRRPDLITAGEDDYAQG